MSRARAAVLVPAFLVASGAVIATAHGLFAVADAARVPWPIACLYPLITDGLALVAYAATHQLAKTGKRYAWCVVVLAALLSGVAQAVFLAAGAQKVAMPPWLAFAVGAWPAVAAAVVAHLVYLLARRPVPDQTMASATGQNLEEASDATTPPATLATGGDQPKPDVEPAEVETVGEHVAKLHILPPPDRATQLIAAGIGRKRLARELDVTEHEARQMIDAARKAQQG